MTNPSKIYGVFAGTHYYPGGGIHDLNELFLTREDAIEHAVKILGENDWVHVVDMTSGEILYERSR